MSWVLGVVHRQPSQNTIEQISKHHSTPLSVIQAPNLYLAVGGIPQTCLYGFFSGEGTALEGGWLVLGLGLKRGEEGCRVVSADEWQRIISSPSPILHALDGHFAIITWKPGEVCWYTDQLGMRNFYLSIGKDEIVFSTRIDWLAQIVGHRHIDFESFGPHWLTFNQLSSRSLLKGIQKLGAGGVARYTPTSLTITQRPWEPYPSENSGEMLSSRLASFIRPVLAEARSVSLGLSGGIDSRVLLSILLSRHDQPFSAYTCGYPEGPDVRIAREICSREDVDLLHFHESLPDADNCLKILREYVGQTCAIEPASSALRMRYFSHLHSLGRIVIDGGFGEIARRQYFNRLLKFGKQSLRSGNPRLIFPYLRVYRSNIFNDEAAHLMRLGVEREIEEVWQTMPDREKMGDEDFLDLLAIRTRFPNWGSYEQVRMDGEIINYMPFAQPSFLHQLFQTPISVRRNSRTSKEMIKRNVPALAAYPLVKNGTTYPFAYSPMFALLWTRAKARAGLAFKNPLRNEFLQAISEFIKDTAHSESVRCYPHYDHPQIIKLVKKYYEGNLQLAEEVDWWLAFEMWREVSEGL